MKYRVTHITNYEYSEPVSYSHNQAHLVPRDTLTQTCISHDFEVRPKPDDFAIRHDIYGNQVAFFSLLNEHSNFIVKSTSEVEVLESKSQLDIADYVTVADVQKSLQVPLDEESRMAKEFMLDSPYVKRDQHTYNYYRETLEPNKAIFTAVNELMGRIFNEFEYDPHFTDMATPLETVFKHKRGVCQDFAHLAIACLRTYGLAARYVSGYLETLPPPGEEKLTGADASHAWFSVFVPGAGWLDFDPTNNVVPMGQHITLAWGRDYSDVTPLKGVFFGGKLEELSVSVDVERIT